MPKPKMPMGAPNLASILALLQQQAPQQGPPAATPPPAQGKMGLQVPFLQANQEFMDVQPKAEPPPPATVQPNMQWRGVGMGGGMVPSSNQPVPQGITSPRSFGKGGQGGVGELLRKTPGEIFGNANPVDLLPGDFFPSLHTKPPASAQAQAAPPAQAQGPKTPSLFERLDEERGGTAEDKQLAAMQGPGPTAQMFTSAAEEVMKRGADTPDKADEILRMEFQGDPEIEDALAQAKIRYGQARQRSGTGPGVLEYVGYALATLAGANPMQAAEAISRRGEKREDERLALQDLMGAQQMKIRNNQMNAQRADQLGMSYDKMGMQQAKEKQRLSERGEDKNFERLKAGRGAALQRLNQLQQAYNYSQNPAEKKALQAEIEQIKRRTQFFGRQLGEPEVDEQGRPIGQASPDAMRLLGLG